MPLKLQINIPFLLLAFLVLAAYGCGRGTGKKYSPEEQELQGGENSYAQRFSIQPAGDYKVLTVYNPWQHSSRVSMQYLLGKEESGQSGGSKQSSESSLTDESSLSDPHSSIPDSLRSLPYIRTPLKRVIAMSTTHVAMLSRLGVAESLVGLSGTSYVYDSLVREAVQDGRIREVGHDQSLNYEQILALQPDVIFYFGVEGAGGSVVAKLQELGIQVVYCAEYLEDHPLGKAEWIKFFGAFYELEAEAGKDFSAIEEAYTGLREGVKELGPGPVVLTGLPWKGSWYVPGGESYLARLIADAGGRYLWEEMEGKDARPMDTEAVYIRALEADTWINPGTAGSLEELRSFDPRFAELRVLTEEEVYNNDLRMGPGGGNDYWESGTCRPDLILEDLIGIFHPGSRKQASFHYYRKLK